MGPIHTLLSLYNYVLTGHPRKRLNGDPFLLCTKLFNQLKFCLVLLLFMTLGKTESIQSSLLQQSKKEYHLEMLRRKVVYFHFNVGLKMWSEGCNIADRAAHSRYGSSSGVHE